MYKFKRIMIVLFSILLIMSNVLYSASDIKVQAASCSHTPVTVTTPATCTSSGSTVVKCSKCGFVISSSTIPSLGHSPAIVTTPATCTASGSTVVKCSRCSFVISNSSIPALGHSSTTEVKEPTCKSEGYIKSYCTRCNATLSNTVVPALAHSSTKEVKSPNCTEDGYIRSYCTKCNETLSNTVVPRLGHTSPETEEVAPTATANGYQRTYCSRCLTEFSRVSTYLVSYYAMKDTNTITTQKKTEGVPLTLISTVPSRAGYTYLGWSASSTATTATYPSGGTYTGNSAISLYAVWTPNISDICFDANGGTNAPAPIRKTTDVTITLPADIPVKSNYVFGGWSDDKTAKTGKFQPGTPFTKNGPITLSAVWNYKVNYDANGGTFSNGAKENVDLGAYGTNYTVISNEPTKAGCTFWGWAFVSTAPKGAFGTGLSYNLDQYNGDVKLYAIWKGTFLVNYNANGGKYADNTNLKTQSGDYSDGTFTVDNSICPTKAGGKFFAWTLDPNCPEPFVYSGQSYPTSQFSPETHLYALWYSDFTIKYDANGGKYSDGSTMKSQTDSYGNTSFTVMDTKPEWSGHKFIGWARTKDGTIPTIFSNQNLNPDTFDPASTLFAVWATDYNVNYYVDGVKTYVQPGKYDTSFSVKYANPTKTGYQFLGWSLTSDSTAVKYIGGNAYDANELNPSTSLYAVWKLGTYIITFDANGGGGAPASITKNYGEKVQIPATLPNRGNLAFKGWATEKPAVSVTFNPGDEYSYDSDKELFAVWELNVTYHISDCTFMGNIYVGSNTRAYSYTIDNFKFLSAEGTEVSFKGWAVQDNPNVVKYNVGDSFSGNDNLEVYALWDDQGTGNPPLDLSLHAGGDFIYNADGEMMIAVGYGSEFPYVPAPAQWIDQINQGVKFNLIPYSAYQAIIDEMQRNWDEAESIDVNAVMHTVLDVAGMVPVIGEPCDGLNAIMYYMDGDNVNALLCAGAIIPVIGGGITGVKLTAKGVKYADELVDTYRYMNRVSGFSSFSALKRSLGPAGEGKAWHHIVEQCQIEKSGFATEKIQNVDNVIAVPHGSGSVHSKISTYYSSMQDFTNGKTFREWLTGQSYEKQFEEGMKVLNRYGDIVKGSDGIWKFTPFN